MTGMVFLDGYDRLCVRVPFLLKDVCKSIAGARWNATLKCWSYPASPMAAKAIQEAFPSGSLQWDGPAKELLKEAAEILKAAVHKTATELPAIPLTKTTPWHHQLQAYHFAKALPACMLALDMGTGKSKVAIDLLVNRHCARILIVCPSSVVQVWSTQFERHAPGQYLLAALDEGSTDKRAKAGSLAVELAQVRHLPVIVVVNYEAAWRGAMGTWILNTAWDAVVLDESHRIKQPGGKASQFFSRLGDKTPMRLCLTGTPMPHSPLDIYAQYRFLDKGIYGTSFTVFRSRYALLQQVGVHHGAQKVIGYQNQNELHEKFYRLAFRVKAEDVQQLPEAVDVVRPVTLSPSAKKLYEQLKTDFTVDLANGRVTAANALTRLLRLQQITSGWIRQDREIATGAEGALVEVDTEKRTVLLELLEDLHDTEPVVVFCRFIHDLEAVHTVGAALGRQSLELSGRRNELREWQSGTAPLLAVQVQSGGVGIDLTRARYCVFYSLGFSLGDYLQARKRTHRPGQTQNVTYLHLIATDTIDAQIYTALENREEIVETILQRGLA